MPGRQRRVGARADADAKLAWLMPALRLQAREVAAHVRAERGVALARGGSASITVAAAIGAFEQRLLGEHHNALDLALDLRRQV